MINGLSAWVLTMTLGHADIRSGAVFPDEFSCVHAGQTWYAAAVDYARRKNLPKPKGWICIPVIDDSKP